jgi:hypothetical protein
VAPESKQNSAAKIGRVENFIVQKWVQGKIWESDGVHFTCGKVDLYNRNAGLFNKQLPPWPRITLPCAYAKPLLLGITTFGHVRRDSIVGLE